MSRAGATTLRSIFPDYMAARQGADVYLAVIGWPNRVAALQRWLDDLHPLVMCENTGFNDRPFGAAADVVFDLYDLILKLSFPDEAQAAAFEASIGPSPPSEA